MLKFSFCSDILSNNLGILDKIRPYLISDGGNVEYVKFEDGIVYLRLLGACDGCPLLDVTLKDGIEELMVSEIDEVKEVKLA